MMISIAMSFGSFWHPSMISSNGEIALCLWKKNEISTAMRKRTVLEKVHQGFLSAVSAHDTVIAFEMHRCPL